MPPSSSRCNWGLVAIITFVFFQSLVALFQLYKDDAWKVICQADIMVHSTPGQEPEPFNNSYMLRSNKTTTGTLETSNHSETLNANKTTALRPSVNNVQSLENTTTAAPRVSNILVSSTNTTDSPREKSFDDNDKKPFDTSPWCPWATCHNSHICQPCKRRFLIIIATGRSASTTLTWMLDLLPGVRMSGENNGEIFSIENMINNIANQGNFRSGTDTRSPWGHNKVPEGAFACVSQHMMETINPPKMNQTDDDDSRTIVGFKTIRLLTKPRDKDAETVKFIQNTFPCARIVVNHRSDVNAQEKSMQAAFHSSVEDAKLLEMNDRLKDMARLFGKQAILLDSTAWTSNVTVLNEAVQWLGFDNCMFQELMEFNTGDGKGQNPYGNGLTQTSLSPKCRYMGGD